MFNAGSLQPRENGVIMEVGTDIGDFEDSEMTQTTENPFFDQPILNSPYEYPKHHWELDADGQPTQRTIDRRRGAEFISPIPKPRQRGRAPWGAKAEDVLRAGYDSGTWRCNTGRVVSTC